MRSFITIAIAAISIAAAPAFAQSQVPHGGTSSAEQATEAKPTTDADKAKIARCRALSDDYAIMNPGCVALMKKPNTMKEGGADNHNSTPHGAPPMPAR